MINFSVSLITAKLLRSRCLTTFTPFTITTSRNIQSTRRSKFQSSRKLRFHTPFTKSWRFLIHSSSSLMLSTFPSNTIQFTLKSININMKTWAKDMAVHQKDMDHTDHTEPRAVVEATDGKQRKDSTPSIYWNTMQKIAMSAFKLLPQNFRVFSFKLYQSLMNRCVNNLLNISRSISNLLKISAMSKA